MVFVFDAEYQAISIPHANDPGIQTVLLGLINLIKSITSDSAVLCPEGLIHEHIFH